MLPEFKRHRASIKNLPRKEQFAVDLYKKFEDEILPFRLLSYEEFEGKVKKLVFNNDSVSLK